MAKVAQSLAKLISQSKKKKTGPYDTQATVKRVEGNTVWVSIPGGVDETPINKTVNCSAGDKVQVRVSGGRAWITGNASAPPTDDKRANEAKTTADNAQVMAVDAKETAKAVESVAVNANTTATTAKTIAEGVNEHFWHDNTGAHITEVTQEEWNEPTDPNYHSGGNTLITTQGMAIRNGLTNLAEFGASGVRVGRVDTDDSIEIASNAIKFCHEGLSYASIEKVSGTRFIDDSTSNRLHFDSTGIHLFDSQGNGLTVSNGDVTASGDIEDGSGNVLSNKADSAGFFKVVDLSWTEPAINAHDHGTTTTRTVPTADIPDGMTLVGIVGWTSGNYRIYPYVFHPNGANSISVTMANATAANSASTTVHAYLLYIKATSA